MPGFLVCWLELFDGDFDARDVFAAKGADFARGVFYDAVAGGMDGKVAASHGAFAGALGHADLADDNHTSFNCLATRQLDAEALAG